MNIDPAHLHSTYLWSNRVPYERLKGQKVEVTSVIFEEIGETKLSEYFFLQEESSP